MSTKIMKGSALYNMNMQALVHCKQFSIDKVNFHLKPLAMNNKPSLALWTSKWNDDITKIPWIKFIIDNDYWNWLDDDCLYKMYIKDNTNLYTIDTVEDIQKIPKLLPKRKDIDDLMKVSYFIDPKEGMNLREFLSNNKYLFDYQELQKQGYDGLHVTDNMVKTLESIKHDDKSFALSIICFDCESTVWFNTECMERIELELDALSLFQRLLEPRANSLIR